MKMACLYMILIFSSCTTSKYIETSLYFGQSKPGGGMITKIEWNSFNENYISATFKEGSSVTSITGNWYDTAMHKLITEPTFMVRYYYKQNITTSKQIDSLRFYYKDLFNQQSVLRVDKKVKATF